MNFEDFDENLFAQSIIDSLISDLIVAACQYSITELSKFLGIERQKFTSCVYLPYILGHLRGRKISIKVFPIIIRIEYFLMFPSFIKYGFFIASLL